ncbi:gamma-glutamyl peptidase 5-like [Iris pallida]|uniref:Gamma-glutamyl peptidase 5-like n=1 Tax=Iris pallida TaxID=29817 RepID=A0AAX6GW77_IRIPA|nr:gamma-glutamyl peptidase 5-like [Iris pallida]
MEKKKRFGVLLCADDSEYVKKKYGGYFQVFVGLLGEDGETWDLFRVVNGELPNDEDIDAYDGFVVTGSCSDAHGDDVWILDLVRLLRRLDSMRKKVLGICFGHQILSRALGGKTGRASKGWDIGVTCIHPSPSNKLLSSLCIPSHLLIIECHRDEVWEPPPHAEVLARSDRTGVEMFRYGEHMMGIQGHPEYTKDILVNLIDRLLRHKHIQTSQAEAAKASLKEKEPDREAWKRLCRSFLKGKSLS